MISAIGIWAKRFGGAGDPLSCLINALTSGQV